MNTAWSDEQSRKGISNKGANMLVREPRSSDKETIISILTEAMGREYLEEMVEEFDRCVTGEYIGYIAQEKSGRIIGYACIRKRVDTYKLETIATDHLVRSKGRGRGLVDHICADVSARGGTLLNVDSNDSDAIRFYLKCGFRVAGIVNDEYVTGITQIHLQKRLTSQED